MSDDDLPIEQDPDVARLRRAYQIACLNITELNDQRAALTDALTTVMYLLDQLLTEMRLANVAPSAGIIIAKADFDRAMRKVLDRDQANP